MKPTLRSIGFKAMAIALAMSMTLPAIDLSAQNRPGRGNPPRQEQKRNENKGGGQGRSTSSKNNPGNRPGNNNQGQRPGNTNPGNRPGNNPGQKPGNNPGQKPGNNNPGQRPGNNPGQRPGNNPGQKPGNPGNHNPGKPGAPGPSYNHPGAHRPGQPHPPGFSWRPTPPPPRPGRPPMIAWRPPTPPPNWRPVHRGPSFSTILGVAIGTALANTVNALISNGYYVDGYQNGAVYLRDVTQYNYFWPDATLRYNSAGVLVGSEYMFTTPAYDLARYSGLYNQMYALYGIPAITSSPGSGKLSATWFGPNNCYITVQYQPMVIDGMQRYCTSLTQGLY